ncbi:MAG: VWA domain-containing protein [Actinomycetota bacterium]
MALVLILGVAVVGIGAMYVLGLMKNDRSRSGSSRGGSGRSSDRGRSGRSGKRSTASSYRRTPMWQKLVPILLLVLAVVCLILGVTGFRFDRQTSYGTAVLVIDTSASMSRTDIEPSRLGAAEQAAAAFIEELPPGIRVGVIAFFGEAIEEVTPTPDQEAASAALSGLTRGRGTRIGDALTLALDSIEADWAKDGERAAAVVLLSDGITLAPDEVPPDVAAERAARLEIPVSTVLLSQDVKLNNDALLEDIATTTGAEAFTAETAGELTQVYQDLGVQLSTDLEVSGASSGFIFAAVVFAIAAAIIVLASQRSDY